ncbi:hypothetical protein BKI52_35365 [marine bacterium AO1-C]|nr:hypothetical protein BKI52_35365 [marine bacterium AO1-C]
MTNNKITMKRCLILCFAMLTINCKAQQMPDDSVKALLLQNESLRKQQLMRYFDSLVILSNEGIPKLLYNSELDLDSQYFFWKASTSEFLSLRLELFKLMKDKEVLRKIVQSTYFRNQFQKLKRNKIPSDSLSNTQIAKMRLEELESNKDILSQVYFKKQPYWIPEGINPSSHRFNVIEIKK